MCISGRAGEKGTAYTLVTEKDKEFAGHLVRNLEGAGQTVPNELLDLAMKVTKHALFKSVCDNQFANLDNFLFQSPWFRKSRFKEGKGKKASLVGRCRGLGYQGDKASTPTTQANYSLPVFKPGLVTGGLAANSAASAGPGSSRIDAMRSAFKQQYMSQVRPHT